ncbi:MAG: hypothetical protein COT84_04990 [Chlamydiae bacterium CG10_big_fil_rev_8_21_14_0_10_35_9]|nr:MAG: hypothetical protein COT84_04990 [Chlamydiae bacterium CG10_big_fil_rev_8_21_14_0_10_35_9]
MNKNFILFISIFIFNYCYSCEVETHRDWLCKVLELIQERFSFSTLDREDIKNNKVIFAEVDTIIEDALATYPDDLSIILPCIRILYIQGNHYLYRDLPILAQKKLRIAKELCEKELSSSSQSVEEICQKLVAIDGRLPSFYAMVLRLLGKAYILSIDPYGQLQKEEGEVSLAEAVKIREYIDSQRHDKRFQDTIDNDNRVNNTHIFKVDLAAYVYLNKDLDEAEKVFLELVKVDNPINQLRCLRRLLVIYQKKGRQEANLLARQNYYKCALETVAKMVPIIDHNPNIYRISHLLTTIGQLYFDPQNPFRDLQLSRHFFEQAKQTCPDELQSISILLHQGLSGVYQEIALLEDKLSKKKKQDYLETSSAIYLREFNKKSERQVIAYEQLGDIYLERGEFIVASTLYSNALSLLRKIAASLESPIWVRLQQKMEQVERAICPNQEQNLSAYIQRLSTYRNRLETMREQAKNMIGKKPVKEVFAYITEEYKKLLQLILKDLIADGTFPPFALVCGGSMSWSVTTPYSDVELAFLIDAERSKNEIAAIKNLSTLLTLRLSAIGETPASYLKLESLSWLGPGDGPSPRGIMLDPFQLATFEKYFIGTPEEFAFLQKDTSAKLTHVGFSFIHPSLILGDPSLLSRYKKQLKRTFSLQDREDFSRDWFKRDLTRFAIKRYHDASGEMCSVKHDLYRSLDVVLYNLAFRFCLLEAKTPWELFEMLEAKGYISRVMANEGLKVLNIIGRLRIQTYLEAQQQREWIDPTMTEIETARNFLKSFHEYVKITFPDVNTEDKSSLDNIDSARQQLVSNKAFYGFTHPIVAQNHACLGCLFIKIGHYHEAIHELKEAIRIDSIMYGTHHSRLINYYKQLDFCKEKIDSQDSLPEFPCYSQCKEAQLAILHPLHKVRDLKQQAKVSLKQGDVSRANALLDLSQIVFAGYCQDRKQESPSK